MPIAEQMGFTLQNTAYSVSVKERLDFSCALFDADGGLIAKLAKVNYEQGFYRHAWAVSNAVGADIRFGLLNPKAIEAAVANPLDKIALDGLKQDGLRRIKRTVTQGLIQGDSYPKMARELKGAFDTSARDTMRIARTEGQRAMVEGQQAAYEEATAEGVEMVQVWDAALDSRTRPDHAALDGVEGRPGGGFDVAWHFASGGWTSGPLQSGIPEQDINCRCRIRGQIKGYAPKSRRIRDEGVQPYVTFADWAKEKGLSRNMYGQKY